MVPKYRDLTYEEAQTLWDCGYRDIEFIPRDKPGNWVWGNVRVRPDAKADADVSVLLNGNHMKKFRMRIDDNGV